MVGSTAFQCEPPVWAPLSLRARWPFRSSLSVFRLILLLSERTGRHRTRKAEYIPLPVALQALPWSGNLFSNGQNLNDSTQSEPHLPKWKLTLAYDGTDFSGWQIQPGEPTIQGELQAALRRITGESPLPQGSGRTDAGVHALGQVASFELQGNIPPENLQRALNRTLPESIRILESRTVRSTFHARHSAVAKTYEYRIFREPICPPFLARYVHPFAWPVDFEALQASARLLEGQHDFLSFAATDPDQTTRNQDSAPETGRNPALPQVSAQLRAKQGSLRTIYSSNWEQRETENGNLLIYRVRGNGFLHHMVRNLVGTMLDVGRGHLNATKIPAILTARSRAAAGPTAPAQGLFLHSVEYPAGAELPVRE
jgi:tRNA pseudouridine38-40 synthase